MTASDLMTWREQQGWTQSGLARALGVNRGTVIRWESGESDLPPYLHLALKALETK